MTEEGMKSVQSAASGHLAVIFVLLVCLAPGNANCGPKQYPIDGTVVALGTDQVPTSERINHRTYTIDYRTYTVKTQNRIFVLKCPNPLDAVLAKKNCYDKKPIEIGDKLHLRIEGHRSAYLRTDTGREQRFDVLSESANEAAGDKP